MNSMHSPNVQHKELIRSQTFWYSIPVITYGKCVAHMRNQTGNLSYKIDQSKKKDVFLNLLFF